MRFYPTNKDSFRAAVVVSRKVHKNAVVRNRIRRRVYDFLGRHQGSLKTGDIVITVLDTRLESCSFEDLERDLKTALTKSVIVG